MTKQTETLTFSTEWFDTLTEPSLRYLENYGNWDGVDEQTVAYFRKSYELRTAAIELLATGRAELV